MKRQVIEQNIKNIIYAVLILAGIALGIGRQDPAVRKITDDAVHDWLWEHYGDHP